MGRPSIKSVIAEYITSATAEKAEIAKEILQLFEAAKSRKEPSQRHFPSPKDKEKILLMKAQGWSSVLIAQKMGISSQTVSSYLHSKKRHNIDWCHWCKCYLTKDANCVICEESRNNATPPTKWKGKNG